MVPKAVHLLLPQCSIQPALHTPAKAVLSCAALFCYLERQPLSPTCFCIHNLHCHKICLTEHVLSETLPKSSLTTTFYLQGGLWKHLLENLSVRLPAHPSFYPSIYLSISLCNPVDQAFLDLTEIHLPLPTILGLKVCATKPSFNF